MKTHLHFEKNTKGRDFIVGDLHGCYDEIQALIQHVKFDEDVDRMFFVGDIGDRGPHSVKCFDMIMKSKAMFSVLGNHDACLVSYVSKRDFCGSYALAENVLAHHGGTWVIELDCISDYAKKIADYVFRNFALVISVGEGEDRFNIVHSALPVRYTSDIEIDRTDLEDISYADMETMLWERPLGNRIRNIEGHLSPTYCGHSICVDGMYQVKLGHINIDTGSFAAYFTELFPIDSKLTMVDHTNQLVYTALTKTCEVEVSRLLNF